MNKFCGGVLTVVMMWHLLQEIAGQCQSSGFTGCACECNIMDACNTQGKPRPKLDKKLTGYSPSGLEQLGKFQGNKQNLAYLCENGAVAVLYDCENRTPIYSATVMNEQQLNAKYVRPSTDFKQSSALKPDCQQKASDFKASSKVKICYKQKANKQQKMDAKWKNALNKGKAASPKKACPLLNVGVKQYAAIHKGHLIAAAYGRGKKDRIVATFTYTNNIPQFGSINSGIWRVKEQALVKWGRENCAKYNGVATENVRMHIIVGVMPSTFYHSDQPRFFGASGFSDYKDKDYPINVPSRIWSAACCTFRYKDGKGKNKPGVLHTFFAVENIPQADDNLPKDYVSFFKKYILQNIVLFPAQSKCNSPANYLKLY